MSLRNAIISASRNAWYFATEPLTLRVDRMIDRVAACGAPDDEPLVSVYIPTHDRVDLLMGRSLLSVLGQTYQRLEVIVVAHGCSDDTVRKVRSVRDSRLSVIEVPQARHFPHVAENYWFAGRVDPSNAGLAACTGEWIATNDDDDAWTPDHVESLLRFARSGGYEFVSGATDTPFGDVEPYDLDGVRVGGIQTWIYRDYLRAFRFNRQCWRKSWDRVCDTDLQRRFRRAGVRMGYLDRVVTHVLPRPGETAVGLSVYLRDRGATERHFAF